MQRQRRRCRATVLLLSSLFHLDGEGGVGTVKVDKQAFCKECLLSCGGVCMHACMFVREGGGGGVEVGPLRCTCSLFCCLAFSARSAALLRVFSRRGTRPAEEGLGRPPLHHHQLHRSDHFTSDARGKNKPALSSLHGCDCELFFSCFGFRSQ